MFHNFFPKIVPFIDNPEKYGGFRGVTNDVTMRHIRVACWMSKSTCIYSHAHMHAQSFTLAHTRAHTQKYVILIVFARQQWFHERTSVLRCTYVAPLI